MMANALTPHRAVRARALTGLIVLLFLGKTLCSYIASLTYRRISCWGSHAIVSSNLVAYRAHAFSLSPSFIARKKTFARSETLLHRLPMSRRNTPGGVIYKYKYK